MTVVGIDLAASATSTGVAVLEGARVVALEVDVDDEAIVHRCDAARRIGIDCPLGWPLEFIDFVTAHRDRRQVRDAESVDERAVLAYRTTDRWIAEHHPPLRPLSVSADRIGHVAFRCAALLPRLTDESDRSGDGRIVETYPAGSLWKWGFPTWRGYKGRANQELLGSLADDVALRRGLRFDRPEDAGLFRTSDHAFDAVVAALTAAAPLEPVPSGFVDVARIEGWIRLPAGSLANPLA